MDTLFQQIFDLLTKAPGNLVYHLVLAFSILSCLQAAVIGRRISAQPYIGRLVFGLAMLLLAQAILFFSSSFAWQGVIPERAFLPPLDRAVVLLSLVWIIWLWIFPAPARLGDVITGFLNLGVILFFLYTYTSWSSQLAAQGEGILWFNSSWMDWAWELTALAIVLIGMAVLLFSRPAGWGFGLGMLSLIAAGIAAHLILAPATGDLSGYVRMGQLAAFPLLPTLLHRLSPVGAAAAVPTSPVSGALPAQIPTGQAVRAQERRRYSASPRTVHAWLQLVQTDDPEQVIAGIAKAVGHTMLADLCFVVGKPAYGHIVLQSGYDLIREEPMQGTMLDQSSVNQLANAIQRGKPLRIGSSDSQPPDMKTLATALGLSEVGSLLFIPLGINDKPYGGLLLLSPYSSRQWTAEDQGYLSSELDGIAQVLMEAREQGEQMLATQSGTGLPTGEQAAALQVELDSLREENRRLADALLELQNNGRAVTAELAQAPDLTALIALQQETQTQMEALQAENERLQAAIKEQSLPGISEEDSQRMEKELRATLMEMAILQNQLAEANARILLNERENRPADTASEEEEREVITSLVQEIRQPMSSILGYTDLLLTESVGILGAMQRNFLERVKASTGRMRSILDDLIQVTTMDERAFELQPRPVELASIIDSAVADTSAQLREKDIALLVDLPEQMPQIHVDYEAVQQITVHLLQNAGAATPPEGAITLRASIQAENSAHYLLLQMTDSGGGVPAEELSRVFARRFRADLPLVQGLGDTGVGLSIAKALVDAHKGRIWVESVPSQSTTISVLLPVRPGVLSAAVQ